MDTQYWNKNRLYSEIYKLSKRLSLSIYDNVPLNSIELAKTYCVNLELDYANLGQVCGVLCRDTGRTGILLNSSRSAPAQNFDCMHELIHYFFHSDINSFQCFDKTNLQVSQNDYLEYQANEGAAELLVPYKRLLPILKDYSRKDPYFFNMQNYITELSIKFFVPKSVISLRIENLKYEISQYLNGIRLNDIMLLSHNEQKKHGINIKSLNTISLETTMN